jgi:hypothetical protein
LEIGCRRPKEAGNINQSKFTKRHHDLQVSIVAIPEKATLDAQIFGRIERLDYPVEKVYFESYPVSS